MSFDPFTLVRCLHVVAIVGWIGGVWFVTFVVMPAIARSEAPANRLAAFHRIEQGFAPQAKLWVLLAGASGFWMTHQANLWSRFADPGYRSVDSVRCPRMSRARSNTVSGIFGIKPGAEGINPVVYDWKGGAAQRKPIEVLCPNRFETPMSPEGAARAAGRAVDLDAIRAAHRTLSDGVDLMLVEGAGGLLVPIAPGYTMAEMAAELGATLLVVARASLGTINHTLLTLEVARHRGLPLAGVVLNRPQITTGPDEATNAEAIARHGAVRVFGMFPHVPGAPLDRLTDLAEKHLDLQGLWDAL